MALSRFGRVSSLSGLNTSVPKIVGPLPWAIVEIADGELPIADDKNATIYIIPAGDSRSTDYIVPPTPTTIATRGNSTSQPYVQFKQYKMKWGTSRSPFGWQNHDGFILQSNVFDRLAFMNRYMYDLVNKIGSYAVKTQPVEVFMSNGGVLDYRGVHTFQQKIKYDLVGLVKESATNPDTGYIVQRDGGGAGVTTPLGNLFLFEYPEEGEETPAQTAFLQASLDAAEASVYATDWDHPTTGFRAHFNEDSFVNAFIIYEIHHGGDNWARSFYMNKNPGGKWTWGPAWDFDFGFGENNAPTNTFRYDMAGTPEPRLPYIVQFMTSPAFINKVKTKWSALRSTFLADATVISTWNGFRAELEGGPIERTQIKRKLLTSNLYQGGMLTPPLTYDVQFDRNLDWYLERLSELDTLIGNL